ncbi:pollen receptor-like kinase 4 [Solanum tuberosum]|uniref:non-specific serine/threonine protein kinase n=1 Tax=Solanum tuberosum TaxID=4113 RepID=M1AKJ8_SOLTU|nr:PREDICTED: pollen receptor-like kinase 4 [Solanum tuberosum]
MASQKNYKNKNKNKHVLLLVIIMCSLAFVTEGKLSEPEVLLKFRQSLKFDGDPFSTWDINVPPCIKENNKPKWNNLFCESGKVYGLNLENLGLSGTIDLDILKDLPNLRTISVFKNKFEGSLPILNKLPALKTAYFSNNKFSGPIDQKIFEGMNSLKKLHLANNEFTGQLPPIFGDMPNLRELNIQNNKFEGPIPPSYSHLYFPAYDGNDGLCGPPLAKSCNKEDEQKKQESSSSSSSSGWKIALIVVIVVVVIGIVVFALINRRKKNHQQEVVLGGSSLSSSSPTSQDQKLIPQSHDHLNKMEQGQSSAASTPDRASNDGGKRAEVAGQKLLFLKDDIEKFDLPDLLKASAEVLGSGVFGSTYKAALSTGPVMVVKRFRHMNKVGKEDFHEHMRRLGRLSHKNLLPVIAFYYRKEEKLLVFEYVNNVSLAVYLHGNSKSRGNQSLDWPTRLKIVKGVSKGILYLYNELPSLTSPHGHLKSSNVLLTENFEAVLTDYALLPVVNAEHAHEHMISYKAPELKQSGKINRKTDVWTLGMLILEILTGKFPSNLLGKGTQDSDDLATWVNTTLGDESSEKEVFDKEMKGTKDCESEMMKLLKIGLSCCEVDVEKRWDIKEAVERIDEVKEKGDFSSNVATNEVDNMHTSR